MICKRCECSITKKVRHVKVNTANNNAWVWCRHCYKAIGGE